MIIDEHFQFLEMFLTDWTQLSTLDILIFFEKLCGACLRKCCTSKIHSQYFLSVNSRIFDCIMSKRFFRINFDLKMILMNTIVFPFIHNAKRNSYLLFFIFIHLFFLQMRMNVIHPVVHVT